MNHLIFFEQDLEKNQTDTDFYAISDAFRIEHLQSIIDIKVDKTYKAILIDKGLCQAKCVFIENETIKFTLSNFTHGEDRQFDLLVGLARPQTVKKVLEYSAGQPVRKIFFYKAMLSEKSYATSKVFEEKQLRNVLMQGLSQCGRYQTLPEVSVLMYYPENLLAGYSEKYTLSLESKTTVLDHPTILDKDVLFAIGPERGFTDPELKKFEESGFQEILLSKSILRVETAVIALCSQIELLTFQK
jgi:16S rRNA (uracil1498-N3)-methyltransferase